MTDLRQEEYNKFTYLPDIPYKLIEYLMQNDEIIWKLLYYDSPDAWNKSNITYSQKGNLIYDGIMSEINARVFLDYGQDDAWTEQTTVLRVSVVEAIPTNYVWGNLKIGFEVYPHYKVNQLSNYKTRSDMIIQRLIQIFNGADLGEGIGRLYFNYRASSKSKVFLIGNAPFKGKGIIFCNQMLG